MPKRPAKPKGKPKTSAKSGFALRIPDELMNEVKAVASQEERPINTQLVRLIRQGLEQWRAEHGEPPS